jgi:hypothetical protein
MPTQKMDPVVKVFNAFKTLTIPQMETALALCQAEVKQYRLKAAKPAKPRTKPFVDTPAQVG